MCARACALSCGRKTGSPGQEVGCDRERDPWPHGARRQREIQGTVKQQAIRLYIYPSFLPPPPPLKFLCLLLVVRRFYQRTLVSVLCLGARAGKYPFECVCCSFTYLLCECARFVLSLSVSSSSSSWWGKRQFVTPSPSRVGCLCSDRWIGLID